MHSSTSYALAVALASFILIYLTRALPFPFSGILKNNAALQTLGEYLPAYIMMLLVIYEVNIKSFLHSPYGIPAIISLAFLVVIHLWKRQMLLSILSTTVIYVVITVLWTGSANAI